MPPAETYFVAHGNDRYEPTEHAGGAWRDDELHLAPVSGLITHHLERWRQQHVDASLRFSRITFEALGQIARDEIQLETTVVRPGRTIELVETVATIRGRATLRARAWLLQQSDTAAIAAHEYEPMPAPESCEIASSLLDWPGGFIRCINARQAPDARPGRARTWITSDLPLVRGETSQPMAEYVKYLDTANGIAARQSPDQWMFPNVDLTLHFLRQPVGTLVGLDTRVAFGAQGMGVTSSVMHDIDGPVGTIAQSVTIRRSLN